MTADLKHQVAVRRKVLTGLVKFAIEMINELGRETYYHEHSAHTHRKSELRDLETFSFFLDTGHTMFGGNDLIIYDRGGMVCWIRWQALGFDSSEAVVEKFTEASDWLARLNKLIKTKKSVIAQTKKKAQREAHQALVDHQEVDKLQLAAERLKLG